MCAGHSIVGNQRDDDAVPPSQQRAGLDRLAGRRGTGQLAMTADQAGVPEQLRQRYELRFQPGRLAGRAKQPQR
jgi:hypothetical protein